MRKQSTWVLLGLALAGGVSAETATAATSGSLYQPVPVMGTGLAPRAVPYPVERREPAAWDGTYVPPQPLPERRATVGSPQANGNFVVGGAPSASYGVSTPMPMPVTAPNYGGNSSSSFELGSPAPAPVYNTSYPAAPTTAAVQTSSGNFIMGSRALPPSEPMPVSRGDYQRAAMPSRELPPATSGYTQPAPTARAGTVDFVMGGGPGGTTELPTGARMSYGPGTTTTLDLTGMRQNYPPPTAPAPAYTATGNYIPAGGAAPASAPANWPNLGGAANLDGVRLFLPPFYNATADEHAGRAMTELAATALLERGLNLIQTEELLARTRMENAAGKEGLYLDTARAIRATHLLIGTVHEYRHKTDLDGSPAVGITMRLVSAVDGATIWQGTVTKSSRFFSSLSRVALGAAKEMAAKVPLDVLRR